MRYLIVLFAFMVLAGCKEATAPTTTTAPSTAKATAKPNTPNGAASKPVPTSFSEKPAVGTKAKCVVTGEVFEVDEETVSGQHEGRFYPFCCPGCQEDFDAKPAEFAAKK